jgi:hypothetical protein
MVKIIRSYYNIDYNIIDQDLTIKIYNTDSDKTYIAVKNASEYSKYLDIGIDIFEMIETLFTEGAFVINDNVDDITIDFVSGRIKFSIKCELGTDDGNKMLILSLKIGMRNIQDKFVRLSKQLKECKEVNNYLSIELHKQQKYIDEKIKSENWILFNLQNGQSIITKKVIKDTPYLICARNSLKEMKENKKTNPSSNLLYNKSLFEHLNKYNLDDFTEIISTDFRAIDIIQVNCKVLILDSITIKNDIYLKKFRGYELYINNVQLSNPQYTLNSILWTLHKCYTLEILGIWITNKLNGIAQIKYIPQSLKKIITNIPKEHCSHLMEHGINIIN